MEWWPTTLGGTVISDDAILARLFGVVRGMLLTAVALSLSHAQGYASYSGWMLAWLIMSTSIFSRFLWIPCAIIGWLIALYLLPPEVVSWVKTH